MFMSSGVHESGYGRIEIRQGTTLEDFGRFRKFAKLKIVLKV